MKCFAAFSLFVVLTLGRGVASGADPSPQRTDFAPLNIVRNVTYVTRDEMPLQADIFVPPTEGPFPGVLMVHGGAWRGGKRSHMYRDAMWVASHGYTVATISYRLAPEYKFPAQIEDCRDAVRWMRTNADRYKVDAQRIAGWGYSAGGHLAALLGTSDDPATANDSDEVQPPSSRLQAIVAGGAPCDFTLMAPRAIGLAYWLGKTRGEAPELYRLASPMACATKDDPPIFFYHGELDLIVPSSSPTKMYERMKELGVHSELHLVKDRGHVAAFLSQEALPAAVKFLDDELKHVDERAAE
jgi:acetyl esterase/lipase